jgi:hypothetical protein
MEMNDGLRFQSSSEQRPSPTAPLETAGVIIVMNTGSSTSWHGEFRDLFNLMSTIGSELDNKEGL